MNPILGLISKTSLTLILLLAGSHSAYAQWTEVSRTEYKIGQAIIYSNPALYKKMGDIVGTQDLADFLSPSSSRPYNSALTSSEYDCKNQLYRNMSANYYSGQMGKGTIVGANSKPSEWSSLAPQSDPERLWLAACLPKPTALFSFTKWERVIDVPGGWFYADKSSIQKYGDNKVQMWSLMDPAVGTTPKPYRSTAYLSQYDCSSKQSQVMRTRSFSGAIGQGEMVVEMIGIGKLRPVDVNPGLNALWEVACGINKNKDPIRNDINNAFRLGVENANKSLPQMLDADTRLDFMSTGPMSISYHITLVTMKIGGERLVNFGPSAKVRMINLICGQLNGNTLKKDYLDNGVTLNYDYSDKDRNLVAQVVITPADCR